MSNGINVLMLPKWYPNYMDEAEGNYIYRHIKTIGNLCSVTVLYVHSQNKKNGYEILEEDDGKLKVIRVYFNRSNTGVKFLDKSINFFRFTRAQKKGYTVYKKRNQKPDIVHVHSLTRTCLPAARISRWEKIPFIISEHWSGFLKERNLNFSFLKKRIILFFCRKASVVTCVSEKLREGLGIFGVKIPIKVIPNVYDATIFYPGKENKLTENKNFVHISRLDNHTKNFEGILRAFSKAVEKDNKLLLHIFGDGEQKPAQEKYALQLGITENVIFYGYQPQENIAEKLRKSAALIVFSRYESQSCAIIESFACGIPVIATKVGGIPELVNEARGILIEKEDEKALTDSILFISKNTGKYDPELISQYSFRKFSQLVIGEEFLKLYKQLIN